MNPYTVITFQQTLNLVQENENYPIHLVYRFNTAITDMNRQEIHSCLSEICETISNPSTSIIVSKMLFSQVIFILSVAEKPDNKRKENAYQENFYNNISKCSINQLVEFLKEKEQKVVLLFEKKEQEVTKNKMDILTYIDNHYLDCNFSIAVLAEQYGMQLSNMSSYFKKKYGENFQQYVSNLKIKKAKILLKNNTMSLDEISEYLGYSNSSSFGRTFKRALSKTPGEYRSMYSIMF